MRWHKNLKRIKIKREASVARTRGRASLSLALWERVPFFKVDSQRRLEGGRNKKRTKTGEENKNIGACRLCVNDNGLLLVLLLLRLPRVHIAEWGTMSSSDKCNPPTLSLSPHPLPSPTLTFVDGDEWTRIRSIFLSSPGNVPRGKKKQNKNKKNQAKYKIGSQPRTYLIYKYDELSLLSYKD
jgi:hypothetical protein